MTPGIALLVMGGLLLVSGWKNKSLTDVFKTGAADDSKDPAGEVPVPVSLSPATANPIVSGVVADVTAAVASSKDKSGSPKELIDTQVLPLARSNGIRITAGMVTAANAVHGPTVSGGRSDHQGPPSVAWAADMSNGSHPTPQMDKLAKALATRFGIPWSGSGLVSSQYGKYRLQLIYRTNEGGNHYNHVHFGAKKT